jgi:glutaredoxin
MIMREKNMKNQVKLIFTILLLSLFLSLPYPAISAEIYKWKDKDGNIVLSDTPPPSGVEEVEIKKFKEDTIERPKTKGDTPRTKSESFREKRSYGNINVVMYMTSWCPYCAKAREHIQSLNVNLMEYDVEKDKSKREEMLRKSGGSRGVPLIDVEGIIIKGYSPSAIKEAVERRRSL